jgi:PBP1b-binding outer membrane lipoprotein LpoB
MKRFTILLILTFLLNGCAKQDPVETIIDQHQEHINEVLDYAYSNIEQTKDVIFLENEILSCSFALVDVKQAYYSRIAACNAKTDYWRLATFGLFVLLCGAIFVIIKRLFKW